jgi:hypothetical protein
MTDRLEETRPRPIAYTANEVPAPPRFLLWSVIGAFILGFVGVIAVIIIFRNVLQPGQQQRVIDQLPFMQSFLPYTDPAQTLPTIVPATPGGISPEDLLGLSVGGGGEEATTTPEVTPTIEETEVAVIIATTAAPTETPEPSPTVEATLEPTSTPTTQAPVSIATEEAPVSRSFEYEPSKLLTGITYRKQGWNECGPANVTMALSYFGWQNDVKYASDILKWGREDKNVNPSEMVAFVNEQSQLRALTRVGGDIELIKALVSAGFPVILETSYVFEAYDWLGHYRTIVGYDSNMGVFTINDSFLGEGIQERFSSVDQQWQHFNRRFIVVYQPQDEARVAAILGDLADPVKAAEHAFKVAQEEVRQDSTNAYAWFNMGSSLVMMGDYERAAVAYTEALRSPKLPFRVMWYQFGAFEAFYEVGRYEDIVSYVQANITSSRGYIEEIHYWHGKALAAMGDEAGAERAFRQALSLREGFAEARAALDDLLNA